MKVRTKVVLIISLVIICMLLLLYQINKEVLLDGFAQMEERAVRQNVEHALSALQVEMDNLQKINHNWSGSVYNYAVKDSTGENNFEHSLVADTFQTLEIDFVFLVDDSGQIIIGHSFDNKISAEITSLPWEIRRYITDGKKQVGQNGKDCMTGIIILPEGPAL